MSAKPKSVFISVDMEGICGIVDWSQVGGNTGEYDYGRKLMVGDVNAAVEGLLAAGVKEVLVSDAHGGKRNIKPEEIHEEAYLLRGSPKPYGMMAGISSDFDAACYVGYHAMKGTANGILAHTISGSVVDGIWINGRETGEFGLNAALAGWYGVPSVFVSGDAATSAEVSSFVPGISTAVVKWGVGRQAAKCLHPSKGRALIQKTIAEAIGKIGSVKPYRVDEPVEFKLRLGNSVGGDAVSQLPYVERIDGRTVKAVLDDYPKAYGGLRSAISIGGAAMRR